MGLVAPIALYFFHGVLADPFDFLVYFVLVGASFTGQTYWRAIVLCWTLGSPWMQQEIQESNRYVRYVKRRSIHIDTVT